MPDVITHQLIDAKERWMSAVVIGIDPHKASHMAAALDDREIAFTFAGFGSGTRAIACQVPTDRRAPVAAARLPGDTALARGSLAR